VEGDNIAMPQGTKHKLCGFRGSPQQTTTASPSAQVQLCLSLRPAWNTAVNAATNPTTHGFSHG